MLRSVFQKTFFLQRSAVLGFAAAGLFCACVPGIAQTAPRDNIDTRYEEIDLEEGRKRLESFRAQRLDGDYCFRFQLVHNPHPSGKRIRYAGTIWGTWNEQGPLTRVKFQPDSSNTDEVIELILQGGVESKVWSRNSKSAEFELLAGDRLYAPVFDGVVYSPFDLQMPFLYWEQFEYAGTARVSSRIVQQFVMLPPEGSDVASRVGGVRIGLDDTYDALFRVEVLDADLVRSSKFEVKGWKKLQGQYIVKEISLTDSKSEDRTDFRVRAASVGLILADEWFDPCLDVGEPMIPEGMFKLLR